VEGRGGTGWVRARGDLKMMDGSAGRAVAAAMEWRWCRRRRRRGRSELRSCRGEEEMLEVCGLVVRFDEFAARGEGHLQLHVRDAGEDGDGAQSAGEAARVAAGTGQARRANAADCNERRRFCCVAV